jgi:hypothetical protein
MRPTHHPLGDAPGGVAEWTKAVVLKTSVAFMSPWVRIPPPPLNKLIWGGARVVDWGRLLSGCARDRTAGSNPVLPARQDTIRTLS